MARGIAAGRTAQPPRNRVGFGLRLRRALQQARRRVGRAAWIASAAVLIAFVAAASVFFVYTITRSPYFRVRGVEVRGTSRLSRAEVVRLMGLDHGASIFSVPSRRHERAIARNPWIEGAAVRRQFPDRLIVDVTERKAQAIVNLGALSYVDRNGVVFKKVTRGDSLDFPVLTGLKPSDLATPDGRALLSRALELHSLLERDPAFGPLKISEIHVSRETGLSVITTGDATEIRFGPDNFPVKLEALAKLLPQLDREGVRARMIDLGFRNMAVVKPRGEVPNGNTVGL